MTKDLGAGIVESARGRVGGQAIYTAAVGLGGKDGRRGRCPITSRRKHQVFQVAARIESVVEKRPFALLGDYQRSLMDELFPAATTLHRVAISLLFVGILTGLGRATFYLPGNPIPITFQTAGVLLIGGFLGLRWGLFAILVYYFLGMAGVGVFKDGGNGWHYLSGTVTAGYIIGFIAAVPLVGYLSQRGWNRGRILWPMLLGNLFIYVPALLWLSAFDFGWPADGELFSAGMYPFIPGDLVKLMIASLVVGGGWAIADKRRVGKN
ncbi:MAG: biotin transporter BioY [SAR202 cluster bacterium]|nr:biotin transporter BioY [SAR202 cluster bacterium]